LFPAACTAVWAAWIRTLPWRVAVILGVGAGGGGLGSLLAPRLGLVLGSLAAVAAGWGLRFRSSPEAVAWRRGAAGERRTAHLLGPLERHGWVVLHDLAVPRSRANIDHLVIGPGGVFVVDSKQYRAASSWIRRGAVAWLLPPRPDPAGRLVRGRPGRRGPARPGHGGGTDRGRPRRPGPWGKVVVDGVPVVAAQRLPSLLRALPAVVGPEQVASLTDQARIGFHTAA
jgi:Nuclease-related domain